MRFSTTPSAAKVLKLDENVDIAISKVGNKIVIEPEK